MYSILNMAEAISIQKVYEELKNIERKMATKKELKSLADTIGMISNTETIRQVVGSMEDIKHGRVKEVGSVKDLINEM